jgi:hypothetical protein
MTNLLLRQRHPSTPLRMTIFADLAILLMKEPRDIRRP